MKKINKNINIGILIISILLYTLGTRNFLTGRQMEKMSREFMQETELRVNGAHKAVEEMKQTCERWTVESEL